MKNLIRRSAFCLLPATALFLGACGPDRAAEAPATDATAAPEAAPTAPNRSIAIRVQPAAQQTFERRLTVQGTVEAKRYANVAARTDGNLDEIWVDEGDTVEGDQTALFQIDPTRVNNALTIAKQNLSVAKANLAVAKAAAGKTKAEAAKAALDFERYERLHQTGKVTDNEFESREVANEQAKAGIAVADAQVDLAKRQVESAEASVAIAQKNADDSKIIAPLSGTVSSRTAEPGEFISSGRVILRIDDPSLVEVAAFIPAQYYPEVQPGQTAFRLTITGQDAGKHVVTYKAPIINTTLRTFEIKGLLKDATTSLAVPGVQADMAIVFESREAIGVPTDSILWRAGVPTVFVVEEGCAVTRSVETGLQNDGMTEIISGLAGGEIVVTEGQTQLTNGDTVLVQE